MASGDGSASTSATRHLTRGLRRLLGVAGLLVFAAGVQLFVLTEHTDRFFAWTIGVPLTAAFLGAGYWASVAFEWLAVRDPVWARARIVVPAVFVFTTLTLVATLLHLDLFHLQASLPPVTRLVTWLWIGIYAGVPLAMLVLLPRQARVRGLDPPREAPFPAWMRASVGLHAFLMVAIGCGLFVAPSRLASLWPWPLTPLTGRAIGAWLIGMGIAAAQAGAEGDFLRARVASVSYVVFGALQIVALARYRDTPSWDAPQSWVYLALLVSMVGLGSYGAAGAARAAKATSRVTA